ncbi:MAG: glucosaminidase domain-containing protein [Dongiaceae bacterium]
MIKQAISWVKAKLGRGFRPAAVACVLAWVLCLGAVESVAEGGYATSLQPQNAGFAVAGGRHVKADSVHALSGIFELHGYALDQVRAEQEVPAIFLTSLPGDMNNINVSAEKKALFVRVMLPLILAVNQNLEAVRDRLLAVASRLEAGQSLADADQAFAMKLAAQYGIAAEALTPAVIGELLKRVDIIPTSLALAQAAEESGWGTSRFSIEGNALYGQQVYGAGKGMLPGDRPEGKRYYVKHFNSLAETVASYAHNLNTHRSYKAFRDMRAQARNAGKNPDGYTLAAALEKYSERGTAYVATLRTIMKTNDLPAFDEARLKTPVAGESVI